MQSITDLYRNMYRIRLFEEALLDLFSLGVLRGTVHTCLGQEGCAVGVISALDPVRDVVSSNHRGHGHFLAFGGDMRALLKEILGDVNGVCHGVGGSQHLHVQNFYSNGILGGMVPVACGVALAQKLNNTGGVSAVVVGDGAMAEGVIYETLNIAALWKLPLLLIVEDNHIAQTTPKNLGHSTPLEGIPIALGIKTIAMDGNDVLKVYEVTNDIISGMRQNQQPCCLILDTCRLGPHSKGDDTRSTDELSSCKLRDPIKKAEESISEDMLISIKRDCSQEVAILLNELVSK